jgi:hypothetical protein
VWSRDSQQNQAYRVIPVRPVGVGNTIFASQCGSLPSAPHKQVFAT